MLFALTVSADNERGPQYMEQALAAIHQANPRRLPVDLLFARHDRTVALFCRVPPELSATVIAQLGGHYPTATLTRLPDSALTPPNASVTWSADLRLSPDLFPIRRYSQFDDLLNRNASDPLTAIFASLAPAGRDRTVPIITMTIRPASDRRVRHRRTIIRRLNYPFFRSHPRLAPPLCPLLHASRSSPSRIRPHSGGHRSALLSAVNRIPAHHRGRPRPRPRRGSPGCLR